jgi:prevent-host-death family protein
MHVIDFAQAEAHFAELLGRVQAGEEIVVTRADVPVARIMPAAPQTKRPRFGAGKDLLRTGSDFDEPLADFTPYTG